MPGDYSRKTFHRNKHYSGVLMQQGRVQLDADWNEQLDIQLCRTETEALDVIGNSGVPQESDGFKIGIAPGGRDLTISAGRIYVDGILCELEIPATYTTQPYYLNPEFTAPGGSPPSSPPGGALDLVLDGGAYLIFLDVWQREVTALDDRLLREVALGGPDTTARLQNVFQVRLLKIAAISPPQEINCQTAIPDFEQLAALSTGKLNARTRPPTDDENLCLLPPSAGYSRLENQLYRVEIHRSTTNLVTFKWSRDNASIETRIEKIEDDVLTVSDVGKDEVLGFAAGQWVEIIDDESIFKGSPRPLLQIDTVDPAARQITLTGSAQDRAHLANLKLRRWDQIKDANADGVTVPQGNWVDLEGGIQVNFSGGTYRAGDYWLIPARTLTGEIEWPPYEMPNTQPIPQPPRGIRHHYCRLGIVEVDDNGVIDSVSDCRNVFPPLTEISAGCCTVVVRPGDSIQAALDSLPDEGGCVCLRTGEHEIGAPLRIEKSNVSLHGETLGARVTRREGAELLKVAHPNGLLLENVTVSGIYFEFENKGVQVSGVPALIALDRCANSKVDGCIIRAQELGTFAGTVIGRSTDVQVTNCRVEKARYGLWVVSDSTRLFLSDNVLDATDARKTDGGFVGIFLMDAFGSSSIKENRITGFIFGIALNKGLFIGAPFSLASGSTITGNRIARLSEQAESGDLKAFAIDVAASDCVIADNFLTYFADDYGGIAASGAQAVVERNSLRCLAREAGGTRSIGILLGRLGSQGNLGSIGGRVAANGIFGPQDGILLIGNSGGEVLENRIESDLGEARFGIALLASSRVRVQGNRIINALFPIAANQGNANEIADNTLLRGSNGVTLFNQTSLGFTQNRIEDMRNHGLLALQSSAKFALVENRFLSCGYQQAPAMSIGVSQHFGELHIESNEVMNTGVSPDGATISKPAWGVFADLVLEARVQSNNITYSNAAIMDANQEHRALWLRGALEQVINLGGGQLVLGFGAQVLDNKFLGPGRSALIEIAQEQLGNNLFRRFERVFFSNNFCWHMNVAAQAAATVSLFGRSAIVMGNHIKTNVLIPSVDFHGIKDGIYMGNIAQTGPANFGGVPSPIPGFNKP